jgi:leucyl/phenylalanyl-tRNA--protein transferase
MPRRLRLDPNRADAEGLVAVGGEVEPGLLLEAYRRGVFPWFNEDTPVLWWSPDPRAVIELDEFHVPRRLQRTLRSGHFAFTMDEAFSDVLLGCADRSEGTWITPDMAEAYQALHEQGHAHSLEVWLEGRLAGGIYGVGLGGFFSGESMFYRVADASKVALVLLVEHLRERGYQLFDIQMITAHTARFGAREIPRADYLRRLRLALACEVTFFVED